MEFRTHFKIKPEEPKIDYTSSIFLLGSCFVENIGNQLEKARVPSLVNPFGILFHPAAIETFISRAINGYHYKEEEIFYHNEMWHCFDGHSRLSKPDKDELLKELNNKLDLTRNFLKNATHIIITPGTSYGYKLKATSRYVANCHKVPQRSFEKELMPVEEVRLRFENIQELLNRFNPTSTIIFTVSPVRHIKDGVVNNQVSKAHLLAAVAKVIESNPDRIKYFPSFEIMMDDLRDYRFYKEDMVHPSQIAVDYIWERFNTTWFSRQALEVMDEIISIQHSLNHRPFNPDSQAHKNFLHQLCKRVEQLKKSYPHLEFLSKF